MGAKKYLDHLREANKGYNPEDLESHDYYKIQENHSRFLDLENTETGEREIWIKSECRTEEEYIEKWPRRFALIYKNRIYMRAI